MIARFDQACTPPAWARWIPCEGHVQTLLGHLLPSRAQSFELADASREIVLNDGERLLAFERPTPSGVEPSGVRVHLFHGLTGDANADYVRRAAEALGRAGHEIWAVNHRGCGAGAELASRPYHSGSSADLSAVLRASRADAPDLLHVAVGFSLSGNAALLLAAEARAPLPDGVVAINPPIDIGATSRSLGRGFNRLYQRRFLLRLRREVHRRVRAGRTRGPYRIPWGASLCEFDDLYTAPEGGFENGAEYYRRCSTLSRLQEIETPTVILTAADDPFVNAHAFVQAALSPHVFLHIEPNGGHIGYLDRGPGRWIDRALVHYVDQLTRPRG